jgi:hypothetical protein
VLDSRMKEALKLFLLHQFILVIESDLCLIDPLLLPQA